MGLMTRMFLLVVAVTAGCSPANSDAADALVDGSGDPGEVANCGNATQLDCQRCGPPPDWSICPASGCPFYNPPAECYSACGAGYCYSCEQVAGKWAWSEQSLDCVKGPDVPADVKDTDACVPDCAGKQCGDDGCGGSCGVCSPDCPLNAKCEAGQCLELCAPNCAGRFCGDDGCGCSCGTCGDPTKPICDSTGTCVSTSDTFPTSWSKIGAVATVQTPGDVAGVALCPDFNGDGKGDNGLKALAATINPELAKTIPSSFGILFEFVDVADPMADNPGFTLVVLYGRPTAPGATTWEIDPVSFDLTTPSGEFGPQLAFDGAKIVSKVLTANPGLVSLTIPIAELGGNLSLTLQQVQISATITDGSVAALNGTVAGIVTKDQIDATLAKLEATCAAPNPPSICTPIETAKPWLPMLIDLDLNSDGKKDAMSVCFQFTLTGGTIVGMEPAASGP